MTSKSEPLLPRVKSEVLDAGVRIERYIRRTPLEYSSHLSEVGNCAVYLKLENFQLTGTFKIRGAVNKLLTLDNQTKAKGIVSASSGNHGAAVAHALRQLGIKGVIYLPLNAAPAKIEALRKTGMEIRLHGEDCINAEAEARDKAEKSGIEFVSPYNDLKIIGGQGTIGLELQGQLSEIDSVLVPVGGGGLVAGIAGYLKSLHPTCEIIGCQPQNSAVMSHSIKAGKILDEESLPTLSDASAGGIEKKSITFPLCQALVDRFVLVSEEEIREAILLMLEKHNMLIEGTAALPVASFLKERERFSGRSVILIISGCRMGLDTLRKIMCPVS